MFGLSGHLKVKKGHKKHHKLTHSLMHPLMTKDKAISAQNEDNI